MRLLSLGLASALSLLVAPTSLAQEARVDASRQCQAAFANVGEGNFAEALRLSESAIASIPRPLTARTRRTLGACYYNRGRAHEGLGHTRAVGAVGSARPFTSPGLAGATLISELAGLDSCGEEGAQDVLHRAFVVVALREGRIVSRSFTLEESSCRGHVTNRVRLRGANVVLQRPSDAGSLAAGEHPIRSVLLAPR